MASKSLSMFAPITRSLRVQRLPTTSALRLHNQSFSPRINRITPIRAAHTIPKPPGATPTPKNDQASSAPKSEGERPEAKQAYYQLSFTCVPCGHRSHHNISKQGYHHGSTLISCPGCRNRHVISDHLKIFGEKTTDIETIMKEKGQLVKRGTLGEDGDIEFWPDEDESADPKQIS